MNLMNLILTNNAEISLGEGAIVALVCIIIVFVLLLLFVVLVSLLKFIAPKKQNEQVESKPSVEQPVVKKGIKLEDIKDEDMMVSCLVATIDYHEETKKDVRVVSVKQI